MRCSMSEADLTWAKFALLVRNLSTDELWQEQIKKAWVAMSLTSTQKKILAQKGHRAVPVRS